MLHSDYCRNIIEPIKPIQHEALENVIIYNKQIFCGPLSGALALPADVPDGHKLHTDVGALNSVFEYTHTHTRRTQCRT